MRLIFLMLRRTFRIFRRRSCHCRSSALNWSTSCCTRCCSGRRLSYDFIFGRPQVALISRVDRFTTRKRRRRSGSDSARSSPRFTTATRKAEARQNGVRIARAMHWKTSRVWNGVQSFSSARSSTILHEFKSEQESATPSLPVSKSIMDRRPHHKARREKQREVEVEGRT